MEFFTVRDGSYVASELAISRWSSKQLNGVGVCGLLAKEAEKHSPGAGFVPARFTVDLFRPVLNEPITLRSEVVRAGNRVRVVDSWIMQHGQVRARATVLYLAATDNPPGEVWEPTLSLPVPERVLDDPEGAPPLLKCGDEDWTTDFSAVQNAGRKVAWHNLPPLVAGEPFSPFQRAAAIGDVTNLVCHWGSEGVGYINTDVTLTLSRLPVGAELGLQALDHVASAGVAVSTATLYDRAGRLGTCVITALANARRQVDLAELGDQAAALQS
ncbi:acyl-CoA thioesterase domain-containing protein [Nocardia neocaledoniensis]|uniref:acyl-CoA thioesterase domain-containing protein n=1 Tax=Nocardia neocaledoniensis TaxID=236511 RepID=UPI0024537E7E|nr:acyl-CoA thioesterase domain-containing protein [Nocardia neocaledoniensis]